MGDLQPSECVGLCRLRRELRSQILRCRPYDCCPSIAIKWLENKMEVSINGDTPKLMVSNVKSY